jgi:hypothetical protein
LSNAGSTPAKDAGRLLGSFVIVLGGLLVLRALFGELDAVIVVWFVLGAGTGAVAGMARRVWVVLIHGTADRVDYPATSALLNFRAATDAGVPAQLVYCQGGVHGQSVVHCPDLWSRAANAFFGGAAGLP